VGFAFFADFFFTLVCPTLAEVAYGFPPSAAKEITSGTPQMLFRVLGAYAVGFSFLAWSAAFRPSSFSAESHRWLARGFSLSTGIAAVIHGMDALDGHSDSFQPVGRLYAFVGYCAFYSVWGVYLGCLRAPAESSKQPKGTKRGSNK